MFLDLSGLNYAPTTFQQVGQEVYAKRAWSDEWTWLPFLYADTVQEAVAPSVGQASFQYRFGLVNRAEFGTWDYWFPYFLVGAFVGVNVFTRWDAAPLWFGQIDAMSVKPHGTASYPEGKQIFRAFSLEHLLDRKAMYGSYTDAGYIDRPLTFNKRMRGGLGLFGNRSVGLDANGAHTFSHAGQQWTNADIANYIIVNFVNVGGSQPNFYLVGDLSALYGIIEEHSLDGMTPWQALNKLIDRRRGVGFRVLSSGSGDCYIYVFSTLPSPVVAADLAIPGNAFQNVVSFVGERMIEEPEITFDNLAYFDKIVVRGGEVGSMFSISKADGSLDKVWAGSDETQYGYGTGDDEDTAEKHDAERQTEKFSAVYQKFKIPETWNWVAGDGLGTGAPQNAQPAVGYDGLLYPALTSNVWNYGKRIERTLPLEADGSAGEFEPQYRKPFVVVPLTLNEGTEDEETIWAQLDQLEALENVEGLDVTLNSIGCHVDDAGMVLRLQPRINHQLGLNHFDPEAEGVAETNTDPLIDWETMIATVFVQTDAHAKIELFANGYHPGSYARTKFIDMPDAKMWWAVPGTVVGVTNGALQRHEGGILRTDYDRLYKAAVLALAWYGTPRAKLSYSFKWLSLANPCGYMIAAALGPEGFTNVNSVVTRRTWKFSADKAPVTLVETDYEELNFAADTGKGRR